MPLSADLKTLETEVILTGIDIPEVESKLNSLVRNREHMMWVKGKLVYKDT